MADPTDINDPSISAATYLSATDVSALERASGVLRWPMSLVAYKGNDGFCHLPAPLAASAAAIAVALGLGSSAGVNTGTSGATVPLLNGANTWSAAQTINANVTANNFFGPSGGFSVGSSTTDGVRIFGSSHSVDITTNSVSNRLTVDSTGMVTVTRPFRFASFTVSTVPSASAAGAGATVYVSNEAGGAVLAYSDGSVWRRVTDRATIS